MMEMMRRRRRTPPQPPAGSGPTTRRRKLAVDYISTLPNDLLGKIISLLPVKDGGRTRILSSMWRGLWRAAPLNLDCRYDQLDVSHILKAYAGGGPARRFCVRNIRTPDSYGVVDAWFRSGALEHGLQELQLEFDGYTVELLPEASIFRCSNTLCALTLAECKLVNHDVLQGLHLPHLKLLGLERVLIRDESLQRLVNGCPALEIMFIHTSPRFRRLRINSLTLTTICVRINNPTWNRMSSYDDQSPHYEELVIETAPRLQRLIHLYEVVSGLDVSLLSTPSLEILLDWHNVYTGLMSCSKVIQKLPVDVPTKVVHTVKSLAVNMDNLSLDNVVDLMRLFPCLEELYVKSKAWSGGNCWRRKQQNLHEIRLKRVVLEPYMGYISHVNFAKFFIMNARMMESMTFHIQAKFSNNKFLEEQHRKLEPEKMVSRDARIYFTTARCQHSAWNTKQLRDLGLNDPFVCRR